MLLTLMFVSIVCIVDCGWFQVLPHCNRPPLHFEQDLEYVTQKCIQSRKRDLLICLLATVCLCTLPGMPVRLSVRSSAIG